MDFAQPPLAAPWLDVGQTLELFPHLNPAEPWDGAYPCPPVSELENIASYPRGFDPDAEVDNQVICKVEIIRHLRFGIGRGPQVLLCKITEYPQTLAQPQMPFPQFTSDQKAEDPILVDWIVLKVSDGHLFPAGGGVPPWDNWELADQSHTRNSSALKYLYQKDQQLHTIMGSPHCVPSYFGTWVFKLPYQNKDGDQKIRYVGAVAMEFIRGASISELCQGVPPKNHSINLEWDDAKYGTRINTPRLFPREDSDLFRGPEFASIHQEWEPFRMDILRPMLLGVVYILHAGVHYNGLSPQSTFVTTFKDERDVLGRRPRVVFLDYFDFEIYEKTTYAADPRWPDQHPLAEEPRPVHPFERCCIIPLSEFSGWYPPLWDKHPLLFDCWLGRNFGKVEEGMFSVFGDRCDEPDRSLRKLVADYGALVADDISRRFSKDLFLAAVESGTRKDVSQFIDRQAYQDLSFRQPKALKSAEHVLSKKRKREEFEEQDEGEKQEETEEQEEASASSEGRLLYLWLPSKGPNPLSLKSHSQSWLES